MSLEPPRRRGPVGFGVLGVLLVIFCLVVAGVAILLLLDDESDTGSADSNSIHIVYGLTLNPSGFDPHIHISNELGIPFFSVYDTLVYRHPQTMEFVPGLATRWEMSADGLAWTFFLRDDVTFHDGEPFNAQAVAANLDRVMNPDTRSGKAKFLLGPYVDYTIDDDYTITIHLSEPYAPLLDGLSQVYLGMASPKALADYTNNTYQWHQVGTGPYMLDEVVPGEKIILRRNPDYAWGPVFYADVTERSVDVVEFRFYTDPATRSLALESGEVQIVGELLPTDAELLLGNPAIRLHRSPIAGMPQQLFFNTQRAPVDDPAMRQALIYATNRTAIADAVFRGQSPVAYGPLTSVTPYYDPAVAQMYPYEPNYAREVLASLGYSDSDNDGILENNGEPLTLTMVFANWNQLADVAQLIQSQWHDVGIDLELIQVPDFPTLLEYRNEDNFDLIGFYDFAVDASILNQYYMTDGANNWSGFSDAEVDMWLDEATRQSDPETRALLYSSVQQRIMEQAVVLPIREYVNLNGATARLDGVIFTAQGWWPLLRNFQLEP
jgi:peptide/nickel transport system substrate-binding protein